ncbi:biotin transport system permease protein/energy-coupling factor transport system permease protein/energy-coupling factor transport system ATP-binding protein [Paenibacillaceae bacterium GAS479]|nr:biotin transport system permease protein/energy-coupling factor transport system permease protein/energy-coupling factor transport system ATP-binding protein [Paenibacillaceae bacterium GAS479]
MAQSNWAGVLVATFAAAALVFPYRKRIAPYVPALRGYAIITLLLAAVAGLRVSPFGFDSDQALDTMLKLTRLMAVMLLGLPLLSLIPPFRMQRAADQLLSPFARLGLPVSRITLAISLMFRFLPLLAAEWQRYARIAAARGKLPAQPGKVPPRMMASIVIPFLLSLLRLGDAVADALEARGFGHGTNNKTMAFRLSFRRSDLNLIIGAFALWLSLYVLSRLN